tara:strand:- start:137 stop:415 length:279 start_codon:yes stop_codon:yes gene_type:complete
MKLLKGDIDIATNILRRQGVDNPSNTDIATAFMRYHRSGLLENSDWMGNQDVIMSAEWKTYRQALRDLPQNSSPQLDSNNNLTGINWPTKPE